MSERKLELFFINIEVGLTATWEREAGDYKLKTANGGRNAGINKEL